MKASARSSLLKAGFLIVVCFLVCPMAANFALLFWLHQVEGKPLENIGEDGRFVLATGIGLAVGTVIAIAMALYWDLLDSKRNRPKKGESK